MATTPHERGLIVGKLRQYARPIRGAAIFVHATLNRLVAYREDGEIVDLEGFHRIQKASSTGDILYRNSTSYRPLPVGATGEVLTVAGGVPSWQAAGAGSGAPTTADYLVRTADGGLSAERVVTDTASVAWDWGTAGQVKANVPDMVGDTGSGGTAGLVPAPAAGDGAAARVLHADGTWALPQSSGRVYYLDPADASDIAAHYTARTSPSPTAESVSSSALTGTSATMIYAFATEPGEPGIILLPAGTALRHFHVATGASNQVATLTIEVWTCASDGSGAVLRRTNTTEQFGGTAIREITSAEVDPAGYTMLSTDRLLVKVYGSRVSGPATCNLDVYWNGTARAPFVTSTIMQPAGGGTLDHAALTSNLAWTTSGHTSTADRLAGFTGAGAAEATTVSTGLTHSAGALSVEYAPALRETGGPTTLTMGAMSAGQALFRVGSTVVGGYVGLSMADIGTNYYPGCMTYSGILGAGGAMAANTYRATPWLCTRSGTIDRLAVDVTTAQAASNCVMAIWSDSSGAPGTVLAEGTVGTATTGIKTATVSQAVTAGTVYWFTSLTNVANVVFRTPSRTAGVYAAGGFALGAGNPLIIYQVAQAYATPTPAWPGGGAWVDSSNNLPGVFMRFSA